MDPFNERRASIEVAHSEISLIIKNYIRILFHKGRKMV